MVKLSVIIVNYNVQYFLELCLLSVLKASENIQTEIIVVDNNSSDGSCELILEKFPQIILLQNTENFGFSKANNLGVAKAKGEYVLILNPDTVVPEDIFEKIILYSETKKKFGALGVKFIDGTGNFLPEAKRNFPSVNVALKKLLGFSNKYYANHIDQNENKEVEILSGAFMLLKREVYLKNNGFDEDYFMYGEDIDLSYKLITKGYHNYYYGAATIIHYKGESTLKDKRYLKNFYGAMQIFYRKHFKISNFAHYSLNVLFKVVVTCRSIWRIDSDKQNMLGNSLIYIGNDLQTFENIKSRIQTETAMMCTSIPAMIENYELIILDSALLPFDEIIKIFGKLGSVKIKKRIRPENTIFFIGGDSPESGGEVIELL